jgi:hypothetical protein
LTPRAIEGLRTFHRQAAATGLVEVRGDLRFF